MSEQDLLGAFDAPVVEVIGGGEQTFLLLNDDELVTLGAFFLGRKKAKALAKVKPEEHDRVRNIVDFYNAQEVTVDDLVRYVGGTPGTTEALAMSMGKAGVSKADAKVKVKQLVLQRGWTYATGLAMRVTCLFGQPDPNGPAGEVEGDGDGESSEPSTST